MRRAVLWAAALAVALIPSSAGAQSLMLTESDALARLSTNGPRVRAARAGIDIARVDVLSAGRWPNPRVNWDRQAVAGVTEHYVTVSQVLPITGRRAFDVQAASALVSASSSRADDEVRRLRADLRRAFAELVAAQTRERELSAARDRLRELSGVLAKRESEGDAAGFDRLRAEREVFDIESDLVVAATERARAQATLASFFGDEADPSQILAVSPQTSRVHGACTRRTARAGRVDAWTTDRVPTRNRIGTLRGSCRGTELGAGTRNLRRDEVVDGLEWRRRKRTHDWGRCHRSRDRGTCHNSSL